VGKAGDKGSVRGLGDEAAAIYPDAKAEQQKYQSQLDFEGQHLLFILLLHELAVVLVDALLSHERRTPPAR